MAPRPLGGSGSLVVPPYLTYAVIIITCNQAKTPFPLPFPLPFPPLPFRSLMQS